MEKLRASQCRPPRSRGVGQTSPHSSLSSCVLPAPLSPSSTQRSRGRKRHEMLRNTHLPPRRKLAAFRTIASRSVTLTRWPELSTRPPQAAVFDGTVLAFELDQVRLQGQARPAVPLDRHVVVDCTGELVESGRRQLAQAPQYFLFAR